MTKKKKEGDFQKRVKALSDMGMKLRSVAARAGCDPSTLSKIKSGENKMPLWNVGDAIIKECIALGLTDEFLGIEAD